MKIELARLAGACVLWGAIACWVSTVEAAGRVAESSTEQPATVSPERWNGVIEVGSQALDAVIEITRAGEGDGRVTMAIPVQGVPPTSVKDLKIEGAKVSFVLALESLPAAAQPKFELDLDREKGEGAGTMSQAGRSFLVKLRRLKEGEAGGPNRPQHPKGQTAYESREVQYQNAASGGTLAGTLTIPERAKFGEQGFGAVILISGSGAQDRDETLMGHKPFLVLADALTRRGVAVLRVDDRGVGGSTSPKGGAETTDDFASDVIAGIEYLKSVKEIDGARIGLIGHSEGGVIAPMVAAQRQDVAFIVLLAGSGVNGRAVLEDQMVAMLQAQGIGAEMMEKITTAQREVLGLAAAHTEGDKLDEAIKGLLTAQLTPATDAAVGMVRKQMTSAWTRRFLVLDPATYLRQVKCPVLVINGSLDVQVRASQNIPVIVKALSEGGNTEYQVNVLSGLNHLLQEARTGLVNEYGTIEQTMSPGAIELIGSWVERRAGVKGTR